MTYSYSSPLTYGPQQNGVYYNEMEYKKPSAAPAAIAGVAAGGVTGAVIGSRKNPYMTKSGEVLDSFAKTAYENYVNKVADAGKEELKTLFEANKEAAKEICTELKQTPEEFLNRITQDNLNKNKTSIKEKITAGNNTRYQDMKNQIQACWDKDKKKFVKSDSVKEDAFKAIKKSTNGIKGKIMAKYAAIGAVIAGIVGFILGKIFIK